MSNNKIKKNNSNKVGKNMNTEIKNINEEKLETERKAYYGNLLPTYRESV